MLHHKPSVTQKRIPQAKVKDICQALGFGDAYDRPEHDLKDSTQSWRKQYTTNDGTRGKDMTDWRSPKTQNDLLCMTRDFLEMGRYGVIHWPARGKASPRTVPEYPIDREKITELLCQLFYKENVNQAHNAKHPNRGRRIRESVESDRSDHSSGTLFSPATLFSQFPPLQKSQSAAAAPQPVSSTIPKGNPVTKLQSLQPPPNKTTIPHEQRYDHAPTQNSGSLYVPSTQGTEEISSTFLNTTSTLIGSSTRATQPESQVEIFDFNGSDTDVQQKENSPRSLIVVLRLKQARGKRAPTANMQATSPEPRITPTKSRPQQTHSTPGSKSPRVQATPRKSSADSRGKRKDVDGDDEEGEYTPRRRTKRRKPASDNEPSLAKSRPTRRAPSSVHDNEESPIVRNVEHRGNALPTRSRGKNPDKSTKTDITAKSDQSPNDRSPFSSANDQGIGNLVDDAVEYVRNLENVRADDPGQTLDSPNRDQADEAPPIPIPDNEMNREANPTMNTPVAPTGNQVPDASSQSSAPERSQPPTPKPSIKPEIHYYIITSRIPRLSQRHWPEGSLGGKSIDTIFKNVEDFTARKEIKSIVFKLITSQKDATYTIRRDDARFFEAMKKNFMTDIGADLARGNTDFDVELEPDPGVEVDVGREEVIADFTF